MWSRCWLDEKVKNNCRITNEFPIDSRITNAMNELYNSKSVIDCNIELKRKTAFDSDEGYRIAGSNRNYTIYAGTSIGALYGVFRLIAMIRIMDGQSFDIYECPKNELRMLNHWDNLDGSIERGYSGNSFFFENNELIINDRTRDYARMLCSVGINGLVINNVNVKEAACDLINERYIYRVKELSDLFLSYGIRLYLSLNYAASVDDTGVRSADPLEKRVQDFWIKKMDYVYSIIPELGGFLVKADSEGRPGPFTYGRTQADGANMLARAIKPHKGIIIWRCFVYNCQQDWRDLKTDRARSAFDYFAPLDGCFDENVILQIKNGPMDFQVREPVSPLFGALKNTNQMIEFQLAQEYTGQQRHICYLIPWFKEVLEFSNGPDTKVRDIVSGKKYNNSYGGMCAVSNTGNDSNWTGHDLAGANLYGFGRLCFDPDLGSEEISREWILLTLGNNHKVVENVAKILEMSWPAYEKYTSPLGIGWMVVPNIHYGPDPDGYEYSRWGTYHKADHLGIGLDRTDKGTGYAMLYNEPVNKIYNSPQTCPDELKLFFHHLPYDHVLKSGKTVLQHIYDTHFEGAEDVEKIAELWYELEGLIDEDIYNRVCERIKHQLEHSKEWRDVINSYFYRKTLINDEKGRPLY